MGSRPPPRGPRAPPGGDRNRAFESIFGRPSAVHHVPTPSPSLLPPAQYAPRAPSPSAYTQHSHMPTPYNHPNPSYAPSSYSGYNDRDAAYPPSHYRAVGTSASSMTMHQDPYYSPPVSPPSEGQFHPNEQYSQPGMTAAQAYQARVYQDQAARPLPPVHPGLPPGAAPPRPYPTPAYSVPPPLPPGRSNSINTTRSSINNPTLNHYAPSTFLQPPIEDDGSLGLDGYHPSVSDHPATYQPPSDHHHHRTPSVGTQAAPNSIYSSTTSIFNAPPNDTFSIAATSTAVDHYPNSGDTGDYRLSADSTLMAPSLAAPMGDRVRALSAATNSSPKSSKTSTRRPPSKTSARSSHPGSSALVTASRRAPVVYPALLSRVAEAFRDRITIAERLKDGLTYKDSFDGREAVDKIAYIIKTTDRNLALLLGRALDAQKFFHDVTYDHRLRDSPNELYQFRSALPSPFVNGDGQDNVPDTASSKHILDRPSINPIRQDKSGDDQRAESSAVHSNNSSADDDHASSLISPESPHATSSIATYPYPPSTKSASTVPHSDSSIPLAATPTSTTRPRSQSVSTTDEAPLPSGIFTLLTDCYSPTCTRDRLCYSIACPRRLEQQARLNMKIQPGLKRSISKESLGDLVEPGTLWIHSVPKEVADGLSDTEKKRQEAMNEAIYTERDFVRDMEYLRDMWIKPLSTRDIIPEARRADFVTQVFWNVQEIIAVNMKLRDALTKRQKKQAVVDQIGDIFLEIVPFFEPFVKYGAHQLYGKYEFEKEKSSNPAFAAFVEETERLPESRKLELNGYLTKPTTRLARYPLLLEVVLKYVEDGHPDKVALPKVVKMVREFLTRVNTESGKTENRFNLLQLDQQLVFRPGEAEDLRLLEENRELVYKGPLKKRGGQGGDGDLLLFLFDHALLIVKAKTKHEQYKVYRKPIPLELLVVSFGQDDPGSTLRGGARPKSTLVSKRNSTGKARDNGHPPAPVPSTKPDPKGGFPITFMHLGRKGYTLTLWASSYASRKKWLDSIAKQQEVLRERSTIFEPWTISQGFFIGPNRVNCAAPLNHGQRIVYGTDDGVYFSDLRDPSRDPVKMLALVDVTQVDVLEEAQLLIVLSERSVITFPLEALDPRDPTGGLKRAKRISSHTSFFKAGMCLNRMLVCVVKASALSTTIKTLEPIDQTQRGRNKPTFKKLLQGGNDTLKVFKEFYIPLESSSIHFLRTKLCVGCTKGFEIVDLDTLDAQGLLDPNDSSLDFVQKRESVKPMAIYRVHTEFLLCYDDCAFYINKNGWRSRDKWIIHWEGSPTAFAIQYPYVLAFEPTFVEIRHVETGLMAQVIPGNNVSCLFADTPPSVNTTALAPPYNPYGDAYGQHPPSMNRQSMYQQSSPYGGGMPQQPYYPRSQPPTRDEILLTMDDRVVTLRLASAPIADSASFVSIPR